jgi:hypothetical protein
VFNVMFCSRMMSPMAFMGLFYSIPERIAQGRVIAQVERYSPRNDKNRKRSPCHLDMPGDGPASCPRAQEDHTQRPLVLTAPRVRMPMGTPLLRDEALPGYGLSLLACGNGEPSSLLMMTWRNQEGTRFPVGTMPRHCMRPSVLARRV